VNTIELGESTIPSATPERSSEMRACIAINGAFFNTQRMVAQYVANAYFPTGE